ncbi:hypothetical protein OUZ56_008217 [Daphnia magna]|uniref:Uncharacterized protein n=1 Tax=Daphnia magna TaxID=35525 RepID=A0ABR0ACE6_9CRUS|nr:hypothetical protein OUZ56_008217 [Daphnia magna]
MDSWTKTNCLRHQERKEHSHKVWCPSTMSNHGMSHMCWNKLLCGGEASIWDVICQLLVEMEKEHGLDQHCIPHSSLESWCAHSCSGTFSSVQVTNNVREIYHPHETWSLFWLTDLFPVRPKFSPFRESCTTMISESLA